MKNLIRKILCFLNKDVCLDRNSDLPKAVKILEEGKFSFIEKMEIKPGEISILGTTELDGDALEFIVRKHFKPTMLAFKPGKDGSNTKIAFTFEEGKK